MTRVSRAPTGGVGPSQQLLVAPLITYDRAMRGILVVIVGLAGCAPGGDFDFTVTSRVDAPIQSLRVEVAAEGYSDKLELPRPLQKGESVRVTYHTRGEGEFAARVTGLDAAGACAGAGSSNQIAVLKGRAAMETVLLEGRYCGAPASCAGGGILCDTFDNVTAIDPMWTVTMSAPDGIAIDQSEHARGGANAGSLGASLKTPAGFFGIGLRTIFAATHGPLFVRFFAKATQVPRPVGGTLGMVTLRGIDGRSVGVGLNDIKQVTIDLHNIGLGNDTPSDQPLSPTGFVCYELMVDANTTTGGAKLWIDGVLKATKPVPEDQMFVELLLGVEGSVPTGTQPWNLWYDDLILDDKMIGCSR